jgi:hypothetical protein
MTSELERLAELHARGSLTDEEFAQARARVLAAGDTIEHVHSPQVIEDVPPGPKVVGKGGKLKGYGSG